VLLVVEGQGLPLGVLGESAPRSAGRLAEEVVRLVQVPRRVGRPRTRARPGRKPDLPDYRERWVVERTVAGLGGFRRLVGRWEQRAQIDLAFLLVACSLILVRALSG